MKRFLLILSCAVLALSCNEESLKDLTSISRNFIIRETFAVNVTENDPTVYEDTQTVNIESSQSDMDVITIELISVSAEILEYNPGEDDVELVDLTLTVADTNIEISLGGIDLSRSVGETIPFEISDNVIRQLEIKIEDDGQFDYTLTAEIDNSPLELKMDVLFELKATGSLL